MDVFRLVRFYNQVCDSSTDSLGKFKRVVEPDTAATLIYAALCCCESDDSPGAGAAAEAAGVVFW